MNLEKIRAQMRKGVLELCILSSISDKPAYASDIIENLKEGKLLVVEGTLYPLLTRLKNDGFLSYHWEESKSGPPRKYYKMTPLGEALQKELQLCWSELTGAVDLIVNSKSKKTK